jgi:hypothetical protein
MNILRTRFWMMAAALAAGAALAVASCGVNNTSATNGILLPDGGNSGTGDAGGSVSDGGDADNVDGCSDPDADALDCKNDAGKPIRCVCCVNLCQKQVACAGGGSTTVSGTILDPAGKVPVYNAVVYVPNAPIAPITAGATCEPSGRRCDGALSGRPLVATLSDSRGQFVLRNVPIVDPLPLVIQIGLGRPRARMAMTRPSRCGGALALGGGAFVHMGKVEPSP